MKQRKNSLIQHEKVKICFTWKFSLDKKWKVIKKWGFTFQSNDVEGKFLVMLLNHALLNEKIVKEDLKRLRVPCDMMISDGSHFYAFIIMKRQNNEMKIRKTSKSQKYNVVSSHEKSKSSSCDLISAAKIFSIPLYLSVDNHSFSNSYHLAWVLRLLKKQFPLSATIKLNTRESTSTKRSETNEKHKKKLLLHSLERVDAKRRSQWYVNIYYFKGEMRFFLGTQCKAICIATF